ncbi:peptide chain release factor RF2 [Ligilactobacillus ceti DSM 22408]|uniref:Peptide chain release factor 2 n=1 Tax=Ligilactobacillus ceti DSM 22408 TaxID=1122146 RepID=A0A0R2KRQ9_9LACO|nr:peptide chain release factor RF2 [Ligilactobacillus ceti DSM 22408]
MILGGLFDLDQLQEQIAEYEEMMAEPEFWNNQEKAKSIIADNNLLKEKYDTFHELDEAVAELEMLLELLSEDPEDLETQSEIADKYLATKEQLQEYQLNLLLNGEYDHNNALIEIHPGAGGTESQDWGAMLFRMYTRWAEQHNFTVEILDYQAGDEAGVKSVYFLVKGHNAFGYLQGEKGVHRLVRISPFDSAGRRHTSFTSINVMPELDDSVEIELNQDDIQMEVFRASGAGGQHINKTSSAVRLTHVPTGIVVSSQSQRSQFQNRATAESMLRSKLYQLEMEAQQKEKEKIQGEQLDIGWGSQIRSYVFHPYSLVKDHRTNWETGNAQAVMDGALDDFINAYLQWNLQNKS